MSDKKVVIIGGGCAGLAAAWNLKKTGIDFVLYEASERYGGRVGLDHRDGYAVSRGAAFTEPQWKTTFGLLNEFGMMDKVKTLGTTMFGFWRNGKIHYIATGDEAKISDMLKFRGVPFRTIPQAIGFMKEVGKYRKKIKGDDFSGLAEVSEMTSEEFALKYGGDEISNRILNPFLGTMVLARDSDVSAAHPIALLSLMEGMCVIDGGLGSINDELYARVKENVKLNSPVTKVIVEDGAVKGVETPEGFVGCDEVICATDAVLTRQLIPDLPEVMDKALSACKYSKTYHYAFALPKLLVPEHFLALFIPKQEDSILTTVFEEETLFHSGPKGAGLMHTFTAGWHDEELSAMTEEERRRTVIKEIQKYFHEFPDEPIFTETIRYDRAINLEAPGQFVAIEDLKANHMDDVKGLHLAGEYLFLIACTEGAWKTGTEAARSLIAQRN